MSATSTFTNTTNEAQSVASHRLHDASDRIIEIKDVSVNAVRKQADRVGSAIKFHPFVATGIGAAIGLGVGVFVARMIWR